MSSPSVLRATVAVVALLLLPASAAADPDQSSYPTQAVAMGSAHYFFAYEPGTGQELYRAVGAAAPALVKDINPGSESGGTAWHDPNNRSPGDVVVYDGALYFVANDGSNGGELWRSDGTEAGTTLVQDLRPGAAGSYPQGLTVAGGKLYFGADDGTHGFELWSYDATAGAELVADVNPGSGSSNASNLAAFGDGVLFAADDGTHGSELWASDGTAAGTELIADLDPGEDPSTPSSLTVLGDRVAFTAYEGTHGRELWSTDGTAAGTGLLADLNPGDADSNLSQLEAIGDTLYFQADDGTHGGEPWTSDGTAAGTALLKDVNPSDSSYAYQFTELDGTVYFGASDGFDTGADGSELWRTDGTTANTTLVKDINPGADSSWPGALAVAGGELWFGVSGDGVAGASLYRSDGTAAGTVLAADPDPASTDNGFGLVGAPVDAGGGNVAFIAWTAEHGTEPWVTDGTPSGTVEHNLNTAAP